MPDKNEILALDGYVAPEKPTPMGELTKTQKDQVKAIIREQLVDGPMQYQRLRTRTVHFTRLRRGMKITGGHVAALVEEMRAADEFAPGYGGKVDTVAEPVGGEPVDGGLEPIEPK